jgi:hypothetical protein
VSVSTNPRRIAPAGFVVGLLPDDALVLLPFLSLAVASLIIEPLSNLLHCLIDSFGSGDAFNHLWVRLNKRHESPIGL